MERNSFVWNGFLLSPARDFSIFAGLSCFAGDADIDDFILNDAQRHRENLIAVTYLLTIPPRDVPPRFRDVGE